MLLFDELQMDTAGYSNVGELLEFKLSFARQKLLANMHGENVGKDQVG